MSILESNKEIITERLIYLEEITNLLSNGELKSRLLIFGWEISIMEDVAPEEDEIVNKWIQLEQDSIDLNRLKEKEKEKEK